MAPSGACPCGSGADYAECCEPLHDGTRSASTAEEVMRSRYSAFARRLPDYVFRTWHPRTRPADVTVDADTVWTGLDVIGVVAGGLEDDGGEVEFTASYDSTAGPGELHEISRFERRAGRWFYVDGDYPRGTPHTE